MKNLRIFIVTVDEIYDWLSAIFFSIADCLSKTLKFSILYNVLQVANNCEYNILRNFQRTLNG